MKAKPRFSFLITDIIAIMPSWRLLLFSSLIGAAILVGIYSYLAYGKSQVIVEWSTASELDTAGFNLYRSEALDGELTVINQQLIPASENPLTGSQYIYTDTQVTPGKTYYYVLENIDQEGNRQTNGPIAVQAASSGWIELGLPLVAFLVGVWGVITTLIDRRKLSDEI